MKFKRICAAVLALLILSTTFPAVQAARLPALPSGPYTLAPESPAIIGLKCLDAQNADKWSVESGLAAGAAVYGDADIHFTDVDRELEGCTWIRTADASAQYKGEGALAAFTAGKSGRLYIGLPAGVEKPGWMEAYTASPLTLRTASGSFSLYQKACETGDRVELFSINEAHNYTLLYKTDVIDEAPPVPNVTKFWTVEWDAGWYRMETDLQIGRQIYSFDYDSDGSEVKTQNPDHFILSALPEKYIGCDYIVTRANRARDLYFFAEQNIDVYAAYDSRQSKPAQLSDWTATGDSMKIQDETSYNIVQKSFPMGETVLLKATGGVGNSVRNTFYMILPTSGETVSKALTSNPVVAQGEKPEDSAADQNYRYYLNEVFNLYEGSGLPNGYTGSGAAVADANELPDADAVTEKSFAAGENMALNVPYSYNTISYSGSPVDGSIDTYWQNAKDDFPGILTIDLQGQCRIDKITLKLRDYWADRTQNLELQTSTDGKSFTTLIAATDYLFEKSKQNVLDLSFPETTARYVRMIGNSNTGWNTVQLSEIEVYGPAQTIEIEPQAPTESKFTDRCAVIEKTGKEDAVLAKAFDEAVSGKLVFEAKVRSSADNQTMAIPVMEDSSKNPALALYFGEDGYIKSVNSTEEISVAPYTAKTWYTIKLVIDTRSGKYDLWIDHLLKGRDLSLYRGAKDIQTIRFGVINPSCGSLSVDNLRLYDNPEVYTVEDRFNHLETGSLPQDGWSCSENSSAAVAEVPFPSDKSLLIQNTGAAAKAVRSFAPITGDVTVEAKIKASGSGWVSVPIITDKAGRVAVKVAAYRNSFYICSGNNWVYICSQEVPNNYYPADNWYFIKVVLNTYTNRYDFYIDGAKRYSGASFAADVDEVSRLVFAAEQENTLYIDNVKVYDSTSLARGLMPKENLFNVKAFGAKGDGVTDDTEAIAKAIDAAAGTGGTVLLENGVFYTGQITLESDMTLFIDASATILANPDRNVYQKVIPSRGYNGNRQLGRGIIYGESLSNTRITGGGTIQGNGFYAFNENDPSNQRPCTIYITLSNDISVENINMVQSPFWTLVPYESSGFTVRNVSITNHTAPNRDGIDPVNTSNMTVENCYIIAGDDAFCPKSGNDIPSCNIDVREVYMQSYCNGIKFGTDSYDAFKNYTIEDITMKCVGLSGITLQSSDGAEIENITFRRIDMNDVDNVLSFMVGNRCRTPIDATAPRRLGYIRNIVVEDLNYTNPMQVPYSHKDEDVHEAMIIGLDPAKNTLNDGEAHRISNILFKNAKLEMPGGAASVPAFSGGIGGRYPEHTGLGSSTGWAYTIRWADNVRFENCKNALQNPDVRAEIATQDYTDTPVTAPLRAAYVMAVPEIHLPTGTAASGLKLPKAVSVLLEDGSVAKAAAAEWKSDPGYDSGTPGVYTFEAVIAANDQILDADKLTAKATVRVLEQTAYDALKAAEVDMQIDRLGAVVSPEQEARIQSVRAEFKKLSDAQKSMVKQLPVLEAAEKAIALLKNPYQKGDLDRDRRVTVSDVVALRQMIVTGSATDEDLRLGDMDEDDRLTVSDVVLLRQRIVKG